MNNIWFFLMPEEFFSILGVVGEKFDAKINFRRYVSEKHSATWRTASSKDDLRSIYLEDDFKRIYISLNTVPENEQDWQFTENAASKLLEFSGGKIFGNILEMSQLRIFAKQSDAKRMFDAIHKEIKKISEVGDLMCNGVSSPKVYYSKAATCMDMLSNVCGKKYTLPCPRPAGNN